MLSHDRLFRTVDKNLDPTGVNKCTTENACDSDVVLDRELLLKAFINSPKFRKTWEFPSEINVSKIFDVLKSKKRENLSRIQHKLKAKIRKRFKLQVEDGKEVIVSTPGGKRILSQNDVLSVFQSFHDEAGHPGRNLTIRTLNRAWHYIPDTLIRELIQKCSVCCNRRLRRVMKK